MPKLKNLLTGELLLDEKEIAAAKRDGVAVTSRQYGDKHLVNRYSGDKIIVDSLAAYKQAKSDKNNPAVTYSYYCNSRLVNFYTGVKSHYNDKEGHDLCKQGGAVSREKHYKNRPVDCRTSKVMPVKNKTEYDKAMSKSFVTTFRKFQTQKRINEKKRKPEQPVKNQRVTKKTKHVHFPHFFSVGGLAKLVEATDIIEKQTPSKS